jgi:hypothetical protein
MTKEIRNIVIAVVVSLFVGYMVGSIMQTGICPLTGNVICKDTAAACANKKESCHEKRNCEKESCDKEKPAEAAPTVESTEAAQ